MKIGRFLGKHKKFLLFALLVLTLGVVLLFVGPESMVATVGVEGGYLLVFLAALVAVSFLTSTSFYALVITLAASGEFNPLLMGLVAAPALVLGDSLFFFLGHHSRTLFGRRFLARMSEWMLERRSKWVAPIFAYFYTAFTPFPQDILMVALGLGGIPFRRVILPVFFGNVTLITLIASGALRWFS